MLIRPALLAGMVAVLWLVPAAPAPAATCTKTGSNLTGGPARDVLCGTAGNDRLDGQGGNDVLQGDFGDDILIGGPGNDELLGGPGNDAWSGGGGDDHIDLRDGQLDHLEGSCGTGNDTVEFDLVDGAVMAAEILAFQNIKDDRPGCESVLAAAVNEGPNVVVSARPLRVGKSGRAVVRLHCPGSLDIDCKGSLRLGIPRAQKERHAASHYTLAAGQSGSVTARLSRKDLARLRRLGHVTAEILSIEAGKFGDKTTLTSVRLLAS